MRWSGDSSFGPITFRWFEPGTRGLFAEWARLRRAAGGMGRGAAGYVLRQALSLTTRQCSAVVQLRGRRPTASSHCQNSSAYRCLAFGANLECQVRVPPGRREPDEGGCRTEITVRGHLTGSAWLTVSTSLSIFAAACALALCLRSDSGPADTAPDSADLAPRERWRLHSLSRTHRARAGRIRNARGNRGGPRRGDRIQDRARVVKKQKDTGVWGGTSSASRRPPCSASRTSALSQYRRLLQLEWPRGSRPYKLADRVLFGLLSRDEDPALLFEFQEW